MERREKFRKDLSILYLPFYDSLCEILPEQWQPYRGFATFKEQHALYLKGRVGVTQGTVTDADGGESPHCFGCATDFTLWLDNKPLWPNCRDPRWDELVSAVEKVGLRSGREFKRLDVGHNELKIKGSWKRDVKYIFETEGMTRAQEFIKTIML